VKFKRSSPPFDFAGSGRRGTQRNRRERKGILAYDEVAGEWRDYGRRGRGGGAKNLGDAEGAATDDSAGLAVSSVHVGRGFFRAAWGDPAGGFGGAARGGGSESFADGARGDAVAGAERRGGSGDQRAAQGSRPAAD